MKSKTVFIIILTVLLAMLVGIVFFMISNLEEVEQTAPITTPPATVTVVLSTEATQCIRIGSADTDPTLHNLEWLGITTDYESGRWIIDGEIVGTAENEDEAFDACGSVELITRIEKEQTDAINAGAEPDYGI